jgi:hypothetical protein
MIPYDRAGKISTGDHVGKFVKIKELPDNPSSFLVLLAHDARFEKGCGDYWVEDYASLLEFFTEAKWVIEWSENDNI